MIKTKVWSGKKIKKIYATLNQGGALQLCTNLKKDQLLFQWAQTIISHKNCMQKMYKYFLSYFASGS